MSLGSLVLKLRQKYGHGLRVAWYRDHVRPRILETPSVVDTTDDRCEVHVLTSVQDWLNSVWAIKTFYWMSGRSYRLCIHDDGSLTPEHVAQIEKHFPNARLIRRHEADAIMLPRLESFPRIRKLREVHTLGLKAFDFPSLAESERLLYLDSDVLFFARPDVLIERLEDAGYRKNSMNRDISTAYCIDPDVFERETGVRIIDEFNSGLGLIHRESMRFEWMEEALSVPDFLGGHHWRFEQTLCAICSSRYGVELLPDDYQVHRGSRRDGVPVRHYVGEIRHLMYGEGMRDLKYLLRKD